jgi:cell division protein FtsQ
LAGLLLGGLICGGCLLWVWLNNPNTLPFREIKLAGQFQHLNSNTLSEQIHEKIKGGFFSLNLPGLKKELEVIPWVEGVSIRRVPGILLVKIEEYQPVARWNNQSLLNPKGIIFSVPDVEIPAGLPLLQGPVNSEQAVLDNYQQLNTIFAPLNLKIQGLKLNARQNWEMVLDNGIAVTLGREDIVVRAERLVKWYPKLVGDKADQIKHLDLRYQNGIAIEWVSRK